MEDEIHSYDPEYDEVKYTKRELLVEVREAFTAGILEGFKQVVMCPLSFEGRWTPDSVYRAGSYVHHKGQGWITSVMTASEPSAENSYWRSIDLPYGKTLEEK